MRKNPYESYKQQSVMTMTPGEMLLMLYDEILKELNASQIALKSKNYTEANRALQKVQKILNHLKSTLDYKYDVSKNLSLLYDFFIRRVIHANIKKDISAVDEIIPLIADLRNTYAQADKLSRTQSK